MLTNSKLMAPPELFFASLPIKVQLYTLKYPGTLESYPKLRAAASERIASFSENSTFSSSNLMFYTESPAFKSELFCLNVEFFMLSDTDEYIAP